MKKFVLVCAVLLFAASAAFAQSTMTILSGSAGQVASDLPRVVNGSGDLLIDGIRYQGTLVQLGDLFADLIANRAVGNVRSRVIKRHANTNYNPLQASWTLSGTAYPDGEGLFVIYQLNDNATGAQLKGWEFFLEGRGVQQYLTPSVLQTLGGSWDRYEPNDLPEQAIRVDLPFSSTELTLGGDGDEDWFAFEVPPAPEGGAWFLEAATSGDLDTYLELYTPDDQQYSFAYDDDTDGTNAVITMPISESGLWYLKARGYSEDTEGEYSLSISLNVMEFGEGEPDEGPELASDLRVGVGPLAKEVNYSGDEDWFRIVLTRPLAANEVLQIETLSDIDTYMTFLDEYEGYIGEDDDSGEGANAMYMASNLSAGTYYAIVRGYSGGIVGPYEILANIIVPERDSYEPDDTMATAGSIGTRGESQERTFSPVGDEDWVQIEITRGGNYAIQTSGSLDTYLELYDDYGSIIAENDDGEVDLNAYLSLHLDPGIYFIKVRPYGAADMREPYHLSVEETR